MTRQRSSINNLIWGIVGNVATSVIAIMIPRLFIVSYGSEVNGLLSSVRQIYFYLALLEVGIGDAAVVALYGPIAKQDHSSVNAIMAATNYYYKRIGVIYGFSVLAMGLLYPLLLDTAIPYTVCCLVILLQGSGSVINYMVQGKYNMLLRVDNRNYVTTNLGTVTSILTDLCRIALLLHGYSIVAVQTTYLVFNLVKMLYISYYIRKHYQWLDLSVKPNLKAVSKSKFVFVHQISSLIFSHTDVLILTFVCGLKTVSIYSMYATIYGMVDNVITITSNSVQSALGQVFHSDRKRYMELQEAFEVYYLALVFSLLAIASIFILPFMALYTQGADINYVDWKLPVLFGLYQLLNYGRASSSQIITFAGAFKETQWRAILETAINFGVSLVCVFRFGIYGVLFGTIAALVYRANDMILYANRRVMKRSAWPTYRRWILNFGLFLLLVAGFTHLPLKLDNYLSLFLHAIWISVLVVTAFFGINTLVEKTARKTAWFYVRGILDKLRRTRQPV
ncbi:lipopolysaccharide biosynthesis protein [Flavonifractor hominis]|uniref:Sugar isomerase n=1 Tax=Flavonifractor hominis TaxID=3133178 RepID=A0ABV1ERC4_9FIRM